MIKITEDLKCCDASTANQILEENSEDAWIFLNKNSDIYNDFCLEQITSDYSIAEFIWLKHWSDFIDFLLMEY